MEEVGSNKTISAKSARLKRKVILQGRCLRRSQPDNAKKTHIFNENIRYVDLGDPSETCAYCQAAMWYEERTRKNRNHANAKYSICCIMGRVQLPFLKNPPMLLQQLLSKIDTSVPKGKGPTIYKIPGQSCHLIGSLLPILGKPPKFAQLYIYDIENEIQNRIDAPIEIQNANCGKRIILPSSIVGSQRYMDQLYFDGMTICSTVGFPDLFLTFTCNPYWPKIQQSKKKLGNVLACKLCIHNAVSTQLTIVYIYTIEFQKRGLPHAHILLFLDAASKYPSLVDIDRIISAKIPDSIKQPQLYDCVKKYMMHGPCGHANRKSLCMKDGKCSRYFPKKWQHEIVVDQEGYPVYKRHNDGKYIDKNEIALYNRYVVPYNPNLLLKYQAYLNIEWCNQSASIKYLFKYINKGYDCITATLVPAQNDDGTTGQTIGEIKHYLDAFSQNIVTLTGLPMILLSESDLANPLCGVSCYVLLSAPGWFFTDMVPHCMLNWVPPSTGELYYLGMMLVVVKGPTTYEQIRTIDGQLYSSFREACFAMGFLLFVTMLISNSIERPNHVWAETWECLIDDIVHQQRRIRNMPDELRHIFNLIINVVNQQAGGMLFLYGYGGTGKTFMRKTLTSPLCSKGDIVLTVASSGIASLLLPNGRTTHSKFAIHVPILDNSTCNIHQVCFEALDKTLNDIMCMSNSDSGSFGGKVVVFGGDFGKIILVIPKGSRSDIVHATINASYLWDYCITLKLKKKHWLIDVGDGRLGKGDDGLYNIEIPSELLITNFINPIEAIVIYTYPDIQHKYKDAEFLKSITILASTNEIVDQKNDYILNIIAGEEKEYFSCDLIDMRDVAASEFYESVTPEFLHSLKTSGIPNHKIRLKTNTPIMLIRNLDQAEGLCNGTRLIVSRMTNHLYVAFSRVQSKSGLKIIIHDKEGKPLNITTNVIFKEILQNL
ncbi:hypothetical protein GYH30_054659 [Glycine max]|uniref:ATP-dependent DNA helicase n=1 Tax=Glycine max TaxID=3847 RepID=A0A0R0E7A5_SOYBN|nr:hypothetical protein GYH30_054659 [Glycine max]